MKSHASKASLKSCKGIVPFTTRLALRPNRGHCIPHAIAAPEGIRGQLGDALPKGDEFANQFTQQDFKKFMQGYRSQYEEISMWIDDNDIEGELPRELAGTLLRNGPGLLEIGGKPLTQPLDGDGMICKFAFKDGKVHFQNKYVRTEALMKEQAASKMLYRGAFSVGNPSGGKFFNPFNFTVKGIANTGVLNWGGKLLALYERDLPYELDNDLKTLGKTTLGGAVDTEKQFFGAHYRVVSEPDASKRLIGFNFVEETTLSGGNGVVHFWEFDESFKRLHKTQHKMPGGTFGFIHDILVTDQHYIVLENPINMNFGKLLTKYTVAKACLAECLQYESSKPTKIHVIKRPGKDSSVLGSKAHAVFETTPFFSFHHANAFEASEGRLVVDTVAMTGIDFGNNIDSGTSVFEGKAGRGVVTRLVINGQTGKVQRHPVVTDRAAEFPSVAPVASGKPHQHAYTAGSRVVGEDKWGPQQVVMKVSMHPGLGTDTPFSQQQASTDVWDAGPDQFAQEPIFCPRPDAQTEDDGWVFTMVYDSASDCSHLAVLDAKDLKSGPVARIRLPQRIPYGIHGSFTEQYLGPASDAKPQSYNISKAVAHDGVPVYA
ncbi:hypothetical protein WJX82_009214 [Trebouxia sp. C0006]